MSRRGRGRAGSVLAAALVAAGCAAPAPPPAPPPVARVRAGAPVTPRAPAPPPALAPPPLPAPPPEPIPISRAPPRDEGEEKVREAEALARAGGYPGATRILEELARQPPSASSRDRALYALGRLFVLPDNPARDYRQALAYFDRLVREYPESVYVPDARAWRDLISAYFARTQELERLKRIDVELERQRRP